MYKRIITFILVILVLVSCTTNSIDQNNDGLNSNTNMNLFHSPKLSEVIFKDIYDLNSEEEFDDIFFHNWREVNNSIPVVEKVEFALVSDVFSKLLEVKCLESTENEIATTKSQVDYELSFKTKVGNEHRRYHINFGDSYLLVSLPGETVNIFKHEISKEDYNVLIQLFEQIPDKKKEGFSNIEDNMVRVSQRIPIAFDDNNRFMKYLILHDENLNRIPVLVHLEIMFDDKGKVEPILKSIRQMHIGILGVTDITVLGEFSDGNYYWERSFSLDNDNSILNVNSDNLEALEYLAVHYPDLKVWNVYDGTISYSSSFEITSYNLSIGIGRDPISEELYLSIRDEGN